MKNNISEINLLAEQAYKNKEYIKSFHLHKLIYKKYKTNEILFRLADIALRALKHTNIKLKLVTNLIDIGLKKYNTTFTTELIYLKLKLFRDYKEFDQFNKLYNSINFEQQQYIFSQFEYLHYLIETEKYTAAENTLRNLQSKDLSFFKIFDNFFLEKTYFNKIIKNNLSIKHDIIFCNETISTDFDYIVTVVGNSDIFKKEIIHFIKSLKKTSSKYLLSILIHDAKNYEIKIINEIIENLQLENKSIIFENSSNLNLDSNETKAYYTARRYILANDMMDRFSKTTFVFDADYIINKDLYNYIKLNSDIDLSLIIKKTNRYIHLTISAGQTMFNNTENSKIFLNFYKKYIYYILTYKKIRWHIDQIVLYTAFIIITRFYKSKIIDNYDDNNFEKKDCFFYHTFHGKYKLS